jgi:tRNA-dihydrouridine synthase B
VPRTNIRIGSVQLTGRVVLAAMVEHTTLPFRLIAREFGACLTITEMGLPDRILDGDRMALRMLATTPAERPVAGQLLAAGVEETAAAAKIVAERGFHIADVNLSCPTRRVLEKGHGGAYLKDLGRIRELLSAVVAAAGVPVTIKFRSGYDETSVNAVEVARVAEEAGVAGMILHGRTVTQEYRGPADWEIIRRTKEAVRIPVLGGGSIRTPEDIVRMIEETGCDGVSVARGALGNPWIFTRARALLAGSPLPPPPSREERLRVLLRHLDAEARFLGERRLTPRLTRLALYYAKDLPDFGKVKDAAHAARTLDELKRNLRDAFRGR